MSAPKSLLSCIRDHELWHARFEEERGRQVKRGRCTTLKKESGRLTWCQRKSAIKGAPCDHCLNEIADPLGRNGTSAYKSLLGQTAGAADDQSGFNPRMVWFYVGMGMAAEDTRRVSEESRD